MKPPRIVNEPPEAYRELVVKAAQNIRMNRTSTNLALYYAAQRTGFRPSIRIIMDTLHKTACQIKTARTDLCVHHFITLFDGTLEVNWPAITGLALSDYGFKKSEYKQLDRWVSQPPEEPIYKTLNRIEAETCCSQITKRDNLTVLTPSEYQKIVQAFPEAKNISFPPAGIGWMPDTGKKSMRSQKWTTKQVFEAHDPDWVVQEPVFAQNGSVTGYVHYNTSLPF